MFQKTTALIAGCGYLGRRVARLWTNRGLTTYAMTRDTARCDEFRSDGIIPIVHNLSDAEAALILPDPDVVLWSVGFDRRPGSNRNAIWIDGLRRFLSRLPVRTTPRRIIYTSSTGVYGDGGGLEVDELTLPNPDSEGGKACLEAEQIVREFGDTYRHTSIILRLAGIYGPDRLLRRVSELRTGQIINAAPDDWLNLIHVDDAVRMIECLAASSFAECSIVNVVSAHSVTRREYYSVLSRLVSAPEPRFSDSMSDSIAAGISDAAGTSDVRTRRSSGNRRVVSRFRSMIPVEFQFDDCTIGLSDAVERSEGL